MSKHRKLLIGFGVSLFVMSVLLAGTALAQMPTPPGKPAAQGLFGTFLDKLAKNLNVDRSALDKALSATHNQMVDEEVQQGKLTKEQADKIKDRIKNGNRPLWFPGKPFARKPLPQRFDKHGPMAKAKGVAPDVTIEALARLSGKSADDVKKELGSTRNMLQFLKNNNISQQQLRDEIAKITEARVNQAVADGKMTKEQAQRILDRIKQGHPMRFPPKRK